MTCPSCGAISPEGARFCPSCGHLLRARADERRVVTVLFADLVGFTTLSESRDPEQVKELVDQCFERLVTDVNAFGGRVDKIVGDAIVALFGAPIAHEDDAERAVRAALQMQRTLEDTAGGRREGVQLRIGVNTGEVLTGALRAGGDYTAMGDVVNVASRLQTLAVPGQVVVGPATHAATREVVRYECLGEVQARGREEPVEAWQAIEAVAPPGHRPRRAVTPLVGRAEELSVLRHSLAAAVARSRAHFVLLAGEAGIGKSRLAEELALAATEDAGAIVLEGRCVPYGEANVWWPIAEALRQAAHIDVADAADVLARKCAAMVRAVTGLERDDPEASRLSDGLRYLMGEQGALSEVDPARAVEDARRSLLAVLEAMARRSPLVLVLSELHWADPLVLDLLDQVLERLRPFPVLLLATARPELEDRWTPKPGRHNLVVLHLDALDDESAGRLLTSLLGYVPTPDVRSVLLERSGGNPFFLEELVALLSEAGVLSEAGAPFSGQLPLGGHELPATLRGLVAARLDALPADERATLEDAAVLGRAGPVAAIEALGAARGEPDTAGRLNALATKDLLVLDDGECDVRSELVREVAYDTLTKAARARRHAALADWLAAAARSTDRQDEYLEQLAHHYGAAAELVAELGPVDGLPPNLCDIALDAIERAAVRAKERDLHAVSLRLLDRALRLLPPHADKPQRRVLLERARTRTALHDLPGARADLDEVFRQIGEGEHPRSRARALFVRGQIEQAENDLDASAATLDMAIAAFRRLGDVRSEAEALSQRGMTSLFLGRPAEAEQSIREALDMARAFGGRRHEAWALWYLAWIAFQQGRPEQCEDRLTQASAAFVEAGDWLGVGWVKGLLGWVRFQQGRRAEALALATHQGEDSTASGDRWARGMMLVLTAGVLLWEGRTGEALAPAQDAVRLFQLINEPRQQANARGTLARILVALGRIDDAHEVLEEGRRDCGAGPIVEQVSMLSITEVAIGVHVGEGPAALERVRQRLGTHEVPNDLGMTEVGALAAMAALQASKPHEALALVARRPEQAQGAPTLVAAVTALAHMAAGQHDEARRAAAQVAGAVEATYLDRTWALIATAFASAAQGEPEPGLAAAEEAVAAADSTGDVVAQAVARLGRTRVLEASGQRAAAAGDEASARLRALGITASGWDALFRAASAPSAAAAHA